MSNMHVHPIFRRLLNDWLHESSDPREVVKLARQIHRPCHGCEYAREGPDYHYGCEILDSWMIPYDQCPQYQDALAEIESDA